MADEPLYKYVAAIHAKKPDGGCILAAISLEARNREEAEVFAHGGAVRLWPARDGFSDWMSAVASLVPETAEDYANLNAAKDQIRKP